MKVIKRGNRGTEDVKFDKITERLSRLCYGLTSVDPVKIAQVTIQSLYNDIRTEEIDNISASTAESYKLVHPQYSTLAGRILISNLHKTTPDTFSACMSLLQRSLSSKSAYHYNFIARHAVALDSMIIHDNDYLFDYFGYRTLEHSYLAKIPESEFMNVMCRGSNETKGIMHSNETKGIMHSNETEGIIHSNKSGSIMHSGDIESAVEVRNIIVDRPQYMFMRVAIAIALWAYRRDPTADEQVLAYIKECYTMLSNMYFIHATPTLYNACEQIQQLLSCFIVGMEDSIEGIMKTLSDVSFISKRSGGIGICASDIRSRGSYIRGTNGRCAGLPKILKMFNEAARCWDQGGRRRGAFSVYIEPWHGDIMRFLELKNNQGADTERARDLFYGLWVPDLFIIRAMEGKTWSLFSPSTAPGLSEVYDGMDVCKHCNYCPNKGYAKYVLHENVGELDGQSAPLTEGQRVCAHDYQPVDAFTVLYTRYESEGRAVARLPARIVVNAICAAQRDSGTPYVAFKDHANRMTNQKNVGTIKSSNLCCEIYEWFNTRSYACCTLSSINLKRFILPATADCKASIDHPTLHKVTRMIMRNLDIIIDENINPVSECDVNSIDLRPVAVGVNGIADVFAQMRLPFLSEEAARIDLEIAETIYHAAISESCARAQIYGAYSMFKGSPASRGMLHPDLWMANQRRLRETLGVNDGLSAVDNIYSGRYDWDALRNEVVKHGLRNSLHIAYMPTASTSQILGNNESFEPYHSNIYTKNVLAGKYTLSNTAMITHLIELGLWSEHMKNRIVNDNGSVQGIEEIPQHVKAIYLTVWEMSQHALMKRAAIRAAFIDQSQSLNIYPSSNGNSTLRAIFFAGWKLGLKTGSYYIRSRPAAAPMKNNIAATARAAREQPIIVASSSTQPAPPTVPMCKINDPDCTSCSG